MQEISGVVTLLSGFAVAGILIMNHIDSSNMERQFKGEINTLRHENSLLKERVDGLTIGCLGSR